MKRVQHLLVLCLLLLAAAPVAAQQVPPAGMTREQILAQIQASGLSPEEIHSRAAAMGYDPAEVDAFLSARPQNARVDSDANQRAMAAISAALRPEAAPDSLVAPNTVQGRPDRDSIPIFGREIFRRGSTEFQPMVAGPVDGEYPLGPGDEVIVMLTGEVERTHNLTVSREGLLVVPQIGAVAANGVTLAQLEASLTPRFDRVYSGVGRGDSAPVRLQVLLGRLRTNLVYIVGAVERPGAYQVSSVATVFNALYQAGGPAEHGSFRQIVVRRGGQVVRTVDLYRYIVQGDSRDDVRLQQGDIVHVPVAENRVRLAGSVRRAAIYEILPGEGMKELIAFSGGLEEDADATATIDRVLPAEQRRPGVNRVVVDADLQAALGGGTVALRAGDLVRVSAVPVERREIVAVAGAVRRPGEYQWTEGLTLGALLSQAQGLTEHAYLARAHVFRLDLSDRSRRLIRAEISVDAKGRVASDLKIADRDSVVVYSREELRIAHSVRIDGYVKQAGEYALADGMSLKDLVLAAGGFTEGADLRMAEVARMSQSQNRTKETTHILPVRLSGSNDASVDERGVPDWSVEAEEFHLEHGDRVVIRRSPGFEPHRTVFISGEVLSPGFYVLRSREDRLSEILQRAGGLTSEAYVKGFQLFRKGRLLPTDLTQAMRVPDSRFNVMLEEGDTLVVPKFDGTVLVSGAVAFESRVLYVPGKGLDYYINRSGGALEEADVKRVSVTHQNGERGTIDRVLLFPVKPKPTPGSTIFVPKKAEGKQADWDSIVGRGTAVLTALATLWLAAR
jgi:polysaccharide export outer membrane protein